MAPQRFHEQFDHIQRAMPGTALAMGPYDDGDAHFLYEKGVVLARDGEEARLVEDTVRAHFTETAGLVPDHVRRDGPHTNRTGVTRIRIGDPAEGADTVPHALRALREAEARRSRRLVSRNHVVHIAGGVNACPGDEPVPVARTQPANPAVAEGRYDADTAARVLVIDTGLVHDHDAYPPLAHTAGDIEPAETDADGVLRQYVGHGTFIAGILAAVAPNTAVTVRNTLSDAGAILESEFGARLFAAVDEGGWPDIISLSAGTTTEGVTDGLLGLDAFMRELREQRTLLVAAAGNNSSHAPFWPAAYAGLPEYADSVLSVGALSADGESEACFSNHGPWVQVFAPGERLTSALAGFDTPVPYIYQHSTYDGCRFDYDYSCTCQFPRHTGVLSEGRESTGAKPHQVMFDGLAQWSGTSFATPVVAGLVAAHMTAYGERDPRAARDGLLAAATGSAEVRGARVPVLRPPTWRPVSVADPAVPV
ncbi:S8 family peptidase [Streptomyces camelliae]|uniref:S8/S53 family peptidase n=1 Tax=Streptomyces camelliae TaxID=3004093 RepID=A0ABY7NWN8_9ACTN|nr:S8/S53 family peptidase [Streptomyces sp. HUAS 2-6]WBO62475.1 S8/S53 family peptidase [Streptomyces sp. HUAS 2-6]